ncbi:MAG: LytTR family transcriptional regulator [Bacteroides sp.]|nr:LytTR family transcriptional regulator [Bacteroides sp.]
MNKLTELLRSPYPTLCQRWKTVLIPSGIVFLIIYFLQPFGISQTHGTSKLFILVGYGLVSAIALSIMVYLAPALFPTYHKERNWTLGRDLLSTLLSCFLIAIGNWLYTSWVYGLALNWQLFCVCMIWVALLTPFPIVFIMMWNRNLQLTRNLREATEMNFYLSKKVSSEERAVSSEENEISSEALLFSGGTKERFEVKAGRFLYAEAEGIYVEVNYLTASVGKAGKKLLRATMKQAVEAVEACPFIIRCHRAFLVNIRAVVKVDGNSQGYRLLLEGCESEISVSRAYAKEVKALIENK